MTEKKNTTNGLHEMQRKKADNAHKTTARMTKFEISELETNQKDSEDKIEISRKDVKPPTIKNTPKASLIIGVNLIQLSDEELMDLYDLHTSFIERCLLVKEINRRIEKE